MILLPDKKYRVIVADPPWQYRNKNTGGSMKSGSSAKYPTMSLEEICSLPIPTICERDCVLFLWGTTPLADYSFEVMKSWGFKYKTIAFVWLKHYSTGRLCLNLAPWTLKSTEICLLGIHGLMSKYKKSDNVRQLIQDQRTEHSKKPPEARKRIIELFGDIPRIELFARKEDFLFEPDDWKGWDVWGNE